MRPSERRNTFGHWWASSRWHPSWCLWAWPPSECCACCLARPTHNCSHPLPVPRLMKYDSCLDGYRYVFWASVLVHTLWFLAVPTALALLCMSRARPPPPACMLTFPARSPLLARFTSVHAWRMVQGPWNIGIVVMFVLTVTATMPLVAAVTFSHGSCHSATDVGGVVFGSLSRCCRSHCLTPRFL